MTYRLTVQVNNTRLMIIGARNHYQKCLALSIISRTMSVCQSLSISLTAESIGFFLTGYFLIGPGKVYNYFGGGYRHPPKRNCT